MARSLGIRNTTLMKPKILQEQSPVAIENVKEKLKRKKTFGLASLFASGIGGVVFAASYYTGFSDTTVFYMAISGTTTLAGGIIGTGLLNSHGVMKVSKVSARNLQVESVKRHIVEPFKAWDETFLPFNTNLAINVLDCMEQREKSYPEY